ncbi:hypothetical protein XH87_09245 [Bradyrhizobium sp. CCBAU 53415]|nr:hypothetical protein [Bradyrhizobium sp. CCBAU 53415]
MFTSNFLRKRRASLRPAAETTSYSHQAQASSHRALQAEVARPLRGCARLGVTAPLSGLSGFYEVAAKAIELAEILIHCSSAEVNAEIEDQKL